MAAALNRFISRSANRCKPFFSLINKLKGFEWTDECASAFQQLKDYLAQPPIMSSPKPDEVLFAYIAVVPHAVSLVLIRVDQVLRSADYTGRIAKWGTILGAFDIKYMPRTSVKGQILADLVAEFTEPSLEEVTTKRDMDEKSVGMISQQDLARWEVYVDGAANRKGSGVGLVLMSPERIVIEKSLRLDFSTTNNEAEYEALLMGMSMGEFEVKDERMQGYLNRVKRLQAEFEFFSLLHVPRSSNAHADSLATLATSSEQDLPRVILVEDFHKPTGTGGDAVRVHQIRDSLCWMDSIIKFLKDDTLPEEQGEADKIRRKATKFWLFEDRKLYKRSYSGPYLLCVHPETAESLLKELHEGICGSHTGGGVLNPLSSPWPFAQWGLDIVGPFPKATGNRKYLLVGTDYFTKWVEAEPLANIRDVDVQRFGNGQAEAVNKVTVNGLKKRLDDAKGKWVEELPHVLWAYKTTPRRSTGETPFSMTYGAEAIIPLETGFPTLKTSSFSLTSNDELLEAGLDLIEERRENAMVRLAHY
ncbi:uncharacterized protein LOC136070439 [Quercus suber]|uniref:uncharacterized protein LOC136070439 n=1 Tax=Quercus suber TaxID=58331 RepID=UPI0032DE73E6